MKFISWFTFFGAIQLPLIIGHGFLAQSYINYEIVQHTSYFSSPYIQYWFIVSFFSSLFSYLLLMYVHYAFTQALSLPILRPSPFFICICHYICCISVGSLLLRLCYEYLVLV